MLRLKSPSFSIRLWMNRSTIGISTQVRMNTTSTTQIGALDLPSGMGLLLVPLPPIVAKLFLLPMISWLARIRIAAMEIRIREMPYAIAVCC